MAPLWDSYRGQFVGVLSAMDFILILKEVRILKELCNQNSKSFYEQCFIWYKNITK